MESQKVNEEKNRQSLAREHEQLWQRDLPRGVRLAIDWDDADTYSGVFRSVRVETESVPPDREKALRAQAEALVQRVTFLPEKLALLELDKSQKTAVLRSALPFRNEKAVLFFEIWLTRGQEILFRRIRNENHKRRTVPFVLPWEIADRLIKELISILTF